MTSQENRKKIALITTWYPPINGVAVNRMEAFAKYLSLEFEVHVFCLGPKKETKIGSFGETVHYNCESKVNQLLKSNAKDHRIKHNAKTLLRIIRSKFVKFPLSSWRNACSVELQKTHLKTPFDAILSSFSPLEPHIIAYKFVEMNASVKWIADMRDEMSLNVHVSSSERELLREVENKVNALACCITSVSMPLVEDFKQLCPFVAKVEEIRNGYDHDYRQSTVKRETNSNFSIGYFGTFYGDNKPSYFMEALEKIMLDKKFTFDFYIYGAHQNFVIPDSIKAHVHLLPRLDYKAAIEKMGAMDINYMPLPPISRPGVFSGKVFDYLSVQKPVIACMDKTTAAALLIEAMNAGYIAPFDQPLVIAQQLELAYSNAKAGVIKAANDDDAKSMHRKFQVEKLSKLIQKTLSL
jgi:glycosyltransferase involved in cell wall biosynthesis